LARRARLDGPVRSHRPPCSGSPARAFYRLREVIEIPESARVANARSRAGDRLRRQRDALRPLGVAMIVAVALSTIDGHPAPGLHGERIGVTLALCAFAAALALAIAGRFTALGYELQAAV